MKTLVQAEDWWFYINPLLYGTDWFVQFEDGEPEIVIKRHKVTTPVAGITRARARLREAGLKYEGLEEDAGAAESRYFPPEAKPHLARTYRFQLAAPIPRLYCKIKQEGYVELPGAEDECATIAFSMAFDTVDVCRVWSRDQPKQLLSKFVTGATYRGKIPDVVRADLQEEILIQYPRLDPESPERAERIYGPQMRLMRREYRERLR